jgi:crotonobetaine/carnitine-CoA ligase
MHIAVDEVPWNSMHDLLRARVHQHGDEPRVDIAGTVTFWDEIDRLSDRAAAGLSADGIGPGNRVCSMMDGRLEQLIVCFGMVKLGDVWGSLNTGLVCDDFIYTVHDAGPKALVVETATAARFRDWPEETPLPAARFPADAAPDFRPFQEGNGIPAVVPRSLAVRLWRRPPLVPSTSPCRLRSHRPWSPCR